MTEMKYAIDKKCLLATMHAMHTTCTDYTEFYVQLIWLFTFQQDCFIFGSAVIGWNSGPAHAS